MTFDKQAQKSSLDSAIRVTTPSLPAWVAADVSPQQCFLDWHVPTAAPSDPILCWLLDSGSLTARLKSLSDDDFAVSVSSESWEMLADDAFRARFGDVPVGQKFWSRKVILSGRGEDWIFAHTLVPESALDGELGEVLQLGRRPLGEWLFEQRGLQRSPIEICRLNEEVWARRSWFFVDGKPLLVAEFFLPALLALPAPFC